MGEMARLGLVLMTISLVMAAALGFVNSRTAGLIAQQKEMERQAAMLEVASTLGDSLSFDSLAVEGLANPYEADGHVLAPVAVRSRGVVSGYLFTAYRRGYSSVIETLVCTDAAGIVVSSLVLNQQETPGLGTKTTEPGWIGQLAGHGPGMLVDKDGGDIAAVTGATVSSRAVVGSVAEGLAALEAAGLFSEGGAM